MIPKWKLARELNRIKEQVHQIPWFFFGGLNKFIYDRNKHQRISIIEGKAPHSRNVAILLLFQPKGVLPSTIAQLQHLESKGFAALVVSNAPLSPEDTDKLKEVSFRILLRPNFGYDFGGYRDGILHLLENEEPPKNLIVMNDSIWLQLNKGRNPIEAAIKSEADMFGISYFTHLRKPHLSHIQSYFFRFGERILSDPFFKDFWQTMPVSSNRYTVIRRCEMELTNAFRSRGFSISTMYNDRESIRFLAKLSNFEMRDFLLYLRNMSPRYAADLEEILSQFGDNKVWRISAERYLSENNVVVPFIIQHPSILLKQWGASVLKKDRKGPNKLQREEIIRLGLLSEIDAEIAEELVAWD